MSTQNDFHSQIDQVMSLAVDATCMARTAGAQPLPVLHRERLSAAIASLEKAQTHLFIVRNSDPCRPQAHHPHRQLELV